MYMNICKEEGICMGEKKIKKLAQPGTAKKSTATKNREKKKRADKLRRIIFKKLRSWPENNDVYDPSESVASGRLHLRYGKLG